MMITKEALAMRKLREERKQSELCIYCGSDQIITETMCEACADKKRGSTIPAVKRTAKRYPIYRKPKVTK
jgi:recombinational DNA repair protein RecR